ncbi:MAG TPA: imidazole glycerol phosphate synthase cyclase subunit [Petrotogaceae bacterium]|jgi:cyclase|nr:imidazole glycerol phosphate synthase cyclase subunit [Petrotogaceae bacterium]HNY38332.1 imidazole glycerol phosphate synthase cyclase subunit [Petrotogaceae bacterium]HOG33925.1 imidazole glycerol phosphate synthase cyclase subunit [Petrotogaceae bacterium]HPO26165.1 imidazole glycerol phosphate synthase cyclase subunit [Petrotogaceae bacterium]HPX16768.1 imidazole glycerol phosphate synthase cyclase subunit [Petrotogaceae bacterium]
MLCKRIVVALDVKNGQVVKGVNFDNLSENGNPLELAVKYQQNGADEIIFLDISACLEKRKTLLQLAEKVSEKLSIPFTVGGGVSSVSDATELFKNGADKVFINSAALNNPELIKKLAMKCGSANIIVAVDSRLQNSEYKVYSSAGKKQTPYELAEWCLKAQELGAGELMITSIDRDGTRKGFDLDMLGRLTDKISIPIIISGGAGSMNDFKKAFENGADAALGAGVFHSNTFTPNTLKLFLKEEKINVRL